VLQSIERGVKIVLAKFIRMMSVESKARLAIELLYTSVVHLACLERAMRVHSDNIQLYNVQRLKPK
jgi:hypothetical protein